MRRSADGRTVCAWIVFLAVGLALAVMGAAQAPGAPFGAAHSPGGVMSQSGVGAWILAQEATFYRSLSGFIRASKDNGSAMWGLFGISFLYGVFHAAGPGHGKAVISSYLVANEETWRRGIVLSFVSGALQSIMAVFIVAVMAVVLGATAKSMGSTVHIIEIVSYGLIMLIGLRLLFVKGRSLLVAWREFSRPEPQFEALFASAAGTVKLSVGHDGKVSHCVQCDRPHRSAFHCDGVDGHTCHESAWAHAHGPELGQLTGPGGWRRGLSAAMSVGLRPCSGAIIVLVFALTQDLFWTGIAATLIMGLGTALTVSAIATLAVAARQVASRIAGARSGMGTLAMRVLELGASVLIVTFGGLLLAGYLTTEQLWTFTG
jgi:nickel/cobalt exporter